MKMRLGVAGVIAAAVMTACKITIEVGENVPGFGGTKIEASIDPFGNKTVVVPPQPGIPPGSCVKLTFYGAGGEVLGTTETRAGESVEVPAGTDKTVPGPCDPPEDPDEPEVLPKRKRSASSPASFVAQQPAQFGYTLLPVSAPGGRQQYAEFLVTAANRANADAIADDFVLGLFTEPPPPGVEPRGVVEVEVGTDSSVRVSMFSTAMPDSLAFEWNGAPLYELGGAAVVHASGWYVTTVVVPPALVEADLLGPSENAFAYRLGLSSGAEIATALSVVVAP